MKILIAKHYWKNGENATWEHHPKLDKKIFEYLKKNYHNFAKERKNEIEKDGYSIYVCYEDEKDDHDRDITNITFFVSKSKLKKTLNLCSKAYGKFELQVKLEKRNRNLILMALVVGLVLIIGVREMWDSQSKNDGEPINDVKTEKYHYFRVSWNEQVQNIKEKIANKEIDFQHYLLDSNDTKLIKQLNIFVNPFYEEVDEKLIKYKEYKNSHHVKFEKIIFKVAMSNDDIEKVSKRIIDEDDMDKRVSTVLKMNDINIWNLK